MISNEIIAISIPIEIRVKTSDKTKPATLKISFKSL